MIRVVIQSKIHDVNYIISIGSPNKITIIIWRA